MIEIMYYCDPEKNKECNKCGCYLNGKNCFSTRHKEYSREGVVPLEQAQLCLNEYWAVLK